MMKRITHRLSPALLALLMGSGVLFAADISTDTSRKVVVEKQPVKVMVRLKQGYNPTDVYKSFLNKTSIKANDLVLERSFALSGRKVGAADTEKQHILVLKSTTMTADELLQAAKEIEGADKVEISRPIHIDSTIPDDPYFGDLWGMNNENGADIDAPEAWDTATGSGSVVVGIIDTGINYLHPDLENNVWWNPGEIPDNGIDDDGNGYIDDVHGIDVVNGDSDPMDDNSHGSHCAGTIGAQGNNAVGVVGVNWLVSMAGCKFLDAQGSGYTDGAVECVNYFNDLKANHGINVVVTNNSWGGGGYSDILYDSIKAAGDEDILFAAAAGNESNDNDASPSYPASYDLPSIVSVAATDNNDVLAYFSNYGATTVDLAAPGVDILSTVLGEDYAYKSGTSMATPHVTGSIALLASVYTGETAAERKQRILDGVDAIGSLAGVVLTGGRLNVNNALNGVNPPPTPTAGVTFMHGASIPWGSGSYAAAMDKAFGTGNWTDATMADGAAPFSVAAGQEFVYLDGSDSTANELNAYLQAYRADIEDFVGRGGALLLNAAPNEGGDIDFGFGGVTLVYLYPDTLASTVVAAFADHPIFKGPFTPVSTEYSGNYFSHAVIAGDTVQPIIIGAEGDVTQGQTILGEMGYMDGYVLFGGMTSDNFHTALGDASLSVAAQNAKTILSTSGKSVNHVADESAANLMANILVYTKDKGSIVPPPAPGSEINFDDLSEDQQPIPTNYRDLTWSADFYAGNEALAAPGSGYETGTISKPNIAFNGWGNDVVIDNNTSFTLTSAYLTAAWNIDLNVTVSGWRDGAQVYTKTVILDPFHALKVDFNFENITSLHFHSEGGTNAGLEISKEVAAASNGAAVNVVYDGNKILGEGTHFVLDNMVLNGEGAKPSVKADFNGDGYSDILWKKSGGGHTIWTMNGEGYLGNITLSVPNNRVRGIGDFNGDGIADILWQLPYDSHAVWLMNQDGSYTEVVIGAPAMKAKGVADFNNDGKADIIWEKPNGAYLIWYMDGGMQMGDLFVGGRDFKFEKAGDFNGDGIADLLMTTPRDTRAIWFMGLEGRTGAKLIGAKDFTIDDVADFNGDGNDDVLLQSKLTGIHFYWTMGAKGKIASIALGGKAFTAVATGDYDGDGKSDILWEDSDLNHFIWTIDENGKKGDIEVGAEGWTAQPDLPAERLSSFLAGRTLYTNIDGQMGTLESWAFSPDMRVGTWTDIVGDDETGTGTVSLRGMVMTFTDMEDQNIIEFTDILEDYLLMKIDGGPEQRLYFDETKAREYFLQ